MLFVIKLFWWSLVGSLMGPRGLPQAPAVAHTTSHGIPRHRKGIIREPRGIPHRMNLLPGWICMKQPLRACLRVLFVIVLFWWVALGIFDETPRALAGARARHTTSHKIPWHRKGIIIGPRGIPWDVVRYPTAALGTEAMVRGYTQLSLPGQSQKRV